ncbi:MAG: hypothetical protein EKK55_16290 [Rhodocyclaceae bacterium]|nr:MAG: hypothetical protein EKK55_16290 [Rhodocyclaceae bacterium]
MSMQAETWFAIRAEGREDPLEFQIKVVEVVTDPVGGAQVFRTIDRSETRSGASPMLKTYRIVESPDPALVGQTAIIATGIGYSVSMPDDDTAVGPDRDAVAQSLVESLRHRAEVNTLKASKVARWFGVRDRR